MSAPIPTIPVAKNAAPIASFAPIQKVEEAATKEQASPSSTEEKKEVKSEPQPVKKSVAPKQGSPSAESKPTVTIPPPKEEAAQKQSVGTPTVTSPTPPQSPASISSTQSAPPTMTKDLSAVHDVPATPPAGGAQKTSKTDAPTKKAAPAKKEAPKKKK